MLRITVLTVASLAMALVSIPEVNSLSKHSRFWEMDVERMIRMSPVVKPKSLTSLNFRDLHIRKNDSMVVDPRSNYPVKIEFPNGGCKSQWNTSLQIIWEYHFRDVRREDSPYYLPSLVCSTSENTAQIPATHLKRAISYIYFALNSTSPLLIVCFTLWLYFTGSLFFDIAHYALHKFSKSQSKILRRIGYLHEVHHLYFNRRLKFNNRYRWQNIAFELPVELGCQLLGTLLGYLIIHALNLTGPSLLSWELLTLVLGFEVIRSIVVAVLEGKDSNHMSYDEVVPKDPHSFVVGPEFHAMHHVDPSSYISSSFRVFDWVMGTSFTFRSRRVAIAGVDGVFGAVMKRALEGKGVSCVRQLEDGIDAASIEILQNTDILLLAQNSKDIDCTMAIALVELFMKHRHARPGSLLLPEVWYISNELEQRLEPEDFSGSKKSSQKFIQHARRLYDDQDLMYRHIVTSLSLEQKGSAVVEVEQFVRNALWWIGRGARYVPASFTKASFIGYFRFLYCIAKAP